MKSHFLQTDGNRKHSWHVPNLTSWLCSLAQLEKLSMCCSEFLTGAPGCGAELAAMMFVNMETWKHNLYVFGLWITIVWMYTKTTALSGVNKLIPHMFNAFNTNLLIQVLAICQLCAQLAAMVCFPESEEIIKMYHTRMWADYCVLFTTQKLSHAMGELTKQHLGTAFGLKAWCHILMAFCRKHCCHKLKSPYLFLAILFSFSIFISFSFPFCSMKFHHFPVGSRTFHDKGCTMLHNAVDF